MLIFRYSARELLRHPARSLLAVLGVGAAISVVAALGYRSVSRFAGLAAPWMVLVFVAFGFVGLREFLDETGTSVHSLGELWRLAEAVLPRRRVGDLNQALMELGALVCVPRSPGCGGWTRCSGGGGGWGGGGGGGGRGG